MNEKPKAIVAIWHRANQGKTQTLRALAKQLVTEHRFRYPGQTTPQIGAPDGGDFRLFIEFGEVKVCVESQGDPNSGLEYRLKQLIDEFQPDLIFCATRTRGETPGAVDRIAVDQTYQVIWTSTYQTAENHETINWVKAQHILSLVKDLGFLP